MVISFLTLLLSVCYVSADICTTATECVFTNCGECSVFTIAFFQTDHITNSTFFAFNVSNQCSPAPNKPGVISVSFSLDSPSQGLVLTPSFTSGTYQGSNYQWTVATGPFTGKETIPQPPTKYLTFSATGVGVQNGVQTNMVLAPKKANFEIFRFSVKNYDPVYNWVFRMNYGDQYEARVTTAGLWPCACDNCDSNYQQRVVTPCTLGWPASGNNNNRGPTVFNEDIIVYSFAANDKTGLISLYYADEYPLMLGVGRVVDQATGKGTINPPNVPPLSPVPSTPTCIVSPINFGFPIDTPTTLTAAIDNSGSGNGCVPGKYSCPRPISPVLFLTDITDNPGSNVGDWQNNGTAYLPNKVCGLFYYTVKTVTGKNADGTFTYTIAGYAAAVGSNPPTNALAVNSAGTPIPPWNFGSTVVAGKTVTADDIPVYAATFNYPTSRYEYGVQVAWDVNKLNLQQARNYRFQIMAHDGDSTKIGGDVGEACVNILNLCNKGFITAPGDPKPCQSCDTNPLPNNNIWTYFCSPAINPLPGNDSPINNTYILSKIPKSALKLEPYKTQLSTQTGFIPGPGVVDKAGFGTTCDCVRIIKTCPLNCCGNGRCNYANGVCTCFGPPEGVPDKTTCCPTPAPTATPTVAPTPAPTTQAPTIFNQPTAAPTNSPPPTSSPTAPPCFNNGAGCNGPNGVCDPILNQCNCTDPNFLQPDCRAPPCFNGGNYCKAGQCVNGTCSCPDGFLPPDCSPPPAPPSGPPPPKCSDIILTAGNTCNDCLSNPISRQPPGNCIYCPPPGNVSDPLVGGTCVSAGQCRQIPASSCQPKIIVIPPQCDNNCSGHGICLNLTACAELEAANQQRYGNDTSRYPLSCGNNSALAASYNQTGACACEQGFAGLNCRLVSGGSLVALAALSAGLIALIVILALLGCAIFGGGAVAVTTGVASEGASNVISSPLYQEGHGKGSNPLFQGEGQEAQAYELF